MREELQNESSRPLMLPVIPLKNTDALSQFCPLLDLSFPVPKGARFVEDFPIWDPRFELPNVSYFGVVEGSRLASCAGVRIAKLRGVTGQSIKVALIGAVATHPDYRNAGLASRVVQKACLYAKEQNAAAVFLWGSEHVLYQKLGFELCGEQARISLKDLCPTFSDAGGLDSPAELKRGWSSRLFPILRTRTGGLELEEKDLSWIAAHRNVEWFYLEKQGVIQAYAALGRGIDLPNLIHEWGGEDRSLSRLLSFIFESHPDASVLGSRFLFQKRKWAGMIEEEFLFLAKILDPSPLIQAFQMDLPRAKWERQSHQELCQGIFGPGGLSQDLPVWIWGLDAV